MRFKAQLHLHTIIRYKFSSDFTLYNTTLITLIHTINLSFTRYCQCHPLGCSSQVTHERIDWSHLEIQVPDIYYLMIIYASEWRGELQFSIRLSMYSVISNTFDMNIMFELSRYIVQKNRVINILSFRIDKNGSIYFVTPGQKT